MPINPCSKYWTRKMEIKSAWGAWKAKAKFDKEQGVSLEDLHDVWQDV